MTIRWMAMLAGASALLAGCGSSNDDLGGPVIKPGFAGTVTVSTHEGSDDLLTAGLGKTGLAGTAPAFADATRPTAAELRRAAIYNNYRALVDMTAAGGYGVLYGPNVDSAGTANNGEGLIPGVEYRTYSDDGSGNRNVTLLV